MVIFEWCMYYLSFTPLWVSILFINTMSFIHGAKHVWTEIISLILIPVGLFMSIIILKNSLTPTKENSYKFTLKYASEEKLATAEFLASFIVPLFAFDFTKWESMILFVFFYFVFGYLCVRHNYFCTNIVLDLFGYKIYDCKLSDTPGVIVSTKVISRRNLKACEGMTVYAKGLNNDYYYDCYQKGDEED